MARPSLPRPSLPGQGHLFDSSYYTLLPPGQPANWTLDGLGRPMWLSALPGADTAGRWTQIIPRLTMNGLRPEVRAAVERDAIDQTPIEIEDATHRAQIAREFGPGSMPAISWRTPRPVRRGQPSLEWTRPGLAMAAAWLTDISGCTQREVIDRLALGDGDEADLRAKARRYIGAGRRALCDRGTWPWISVPIARADDLEAEGKPLPAAWWNDEEVLIYLVLWYDCTVAWAPRKSTYSDRR